MTYHTVTKKDCLIWRLRTMVTIKQGIETSKVTEQPLQRTVFHSGMDKFKTDKEHVCEIKVTLYSNGQHNIIIDYRSGYNRLVPQEMIGTEEAILHTMPKTEMQTKLSKFMGGDALKKALKEGIKVDELVKRQQFEFFYAIKDYS